MRVTRRRDAWSLFVIIGGTIILNCCVVLTKTSSIGATSSWNSNSDSYRGSQDSWNDKLMDESIRQEFAENYLATAYLSDGEKEVRMRFGDIIVKETSITSSPVSGVQTNNATQQNDNSEDDR